MADERKGKLVVLKRPERKPEPDATCVSMLKAALARAESGEMTEVVVLLLGPEGADWETTGFEDENIPVAVGMLFVIQQYLSDCLLHADEE